MKHANFAVFRVPAGMWLGTTDLGSSLGFVTQFMWVFLLCDDVCRWDRSCDIHIWILSSQSRDGDFVKEQLPLIWSNSRVKLVNRLSPVILLANILQDLRKQAKLSLEKWSFEKFLLLKSTSDLFSEGMSVPVGRVWCLEASEWLGSWAWAPCQEEGHRVCRRGVCLSWVGTWHSHDPCLHRRGILARPNHVRPLPLQVHSCKCLGMQEGIKSNQITRNHLGFNQDL